MIFYNCCSKIRKLNVFFLKLLKFPQNFSYFSYFLVCDLWPITLWCQSSSSSLATDIDFLVLWEGPCATDIDVLSCHRKSGIRITFSGRKHWNSDSCSLYPLLWQRKFWSAHRSTEWVALTLMTPHATGISAIDRIVWSTSSTGLDECPGSDLSRRSPSASVAHWKSWVGAAS